MVAIVVKPNRASEVVPYQGDQILEDYPILRSLGVRTLFHIKLG